MPASRIVWALGRFAVWVFYRVERVGAPVPPGPVLVVANHPNGLLDPPMIVATAGRAPRFLAKSTLFTMPLVGWFVRAAGAIPVYRRVDAGADASRNREMFAAVEQALADGDVVCLFPEGTTHSRGKLDPLKSGAARIALSAAARGIPVQLLAVGLNFDRKAVMRSDATAAYGRPFSCTHLLDLYSRDPQAASERLTGEIATHLRDLVVEAEPVAESDIVRRLDKVFVAARGVADDASARLERRQRLAEVLLPALRARNPEQYDALIETLHRYERRLHRFGVDEDMLGGEIPLAAAARFTVRELMILALLGPVVALGVAAFFVPYQIIKLLTLVLPISLEERATYKVFGAVLLYPAWTAALVAFATWWNGGAAGVAVAIALPVLALVALFGWEREAAVVETARSYLAWQRMQPVAARALVRQRDAVARMVEQLSAITEQIETADASDGRDGAGQARTEPRPPVSGPR